MKKNPQGIILLHMYTIMMIIWCMVPETRSATDRIFCHLYHFLPFTSLPPSHPPCPLPPPNPHPHTPNNQENQNFEKMKKTLYDIIILHMRNKNEDHMTHGSWDAEHDTVFFVILVHFLLFYPTINLKNQNFEKMKKTHEDIILHMLTKNHDHIQCCSWDMAHDGCNFYFSFGPIFYTLMPLTAQKIKIKKNETNIWRHHHFTHVYQKWWWHDAWFLTWFQRDGWTDRKSDI